MIAVQFALVLEDPYKAKWKLAVCNLDAEHFVVAVQFALVQITKLRL